MILAYFDTPLISQKKVAVIDTFEHATSYQQCTDQLAIQVHNNNSKNHSDSHLLYLPLNNDSHHALYEYSILMLQHLHSYFEHKKIATRLDSDLSFNLLIIISRQ